MRNENASVLSRYPLLKKFLYIKLRNGSKTVHYVVYSIRNRREVRATKKG